MISIQSYELHNSCILHNLHMVVGVHYMSNAIDGICVEFGPIFGTDKHIMWHTFVLNILPNMSFNKFKGLKFIYLIIKSWHLQIKCLVTVDPNTKVFLDSFSFKKCRLCLRLLFSPQYDRMDPWMQFKWVKPFVDFVITTFLPFVFVARLFFFHIILSPSSCHLHIYYNGPQFTIIDAHSITLR